MSDRTWILIVTMIIWVILVLHFVMITKLLDRVGDLEKWRRSS